MDKISILLGVLMLILFLFPIVYVLIQQKAKETRTKKLLSQAALENNIKLDSIEIIGHLSLGLDSTTKKLVVIEFKDPVKTRIIDLKEIQELKINKRFESYMQGESRKEKIIHLSLEFISKNPAQITEIAFYDEEELDSTDAAISLNNARRWDEILQKNMAY
ncbi:hypothetical protein [Christiangramia aquimixticola]|uniref:hypothetical protein n=1 Tax=Christiangramia aquimixticola TaxID=1697558 RepID=UPI003AA88D2F